MPRENKNLCSLFEQEAWLFISDEIDAERKKMWLKHLAECSNCSRLLDSNRKITSLYAENMEEDLLESKFETMIKKAAVKITFKEKAADWLYSLNKDFTFAKTALGGGLAAAAMIFLLTLPERSFVNRNETETAVWNDTTMISTIDGISEKIITIEEDASSADAEWSDSLKAISSQIDSLKFCINY